MQEVQAAPCSPAMTSQTWTIATYQNDAFHHDGLFVFTVGTSTGLTDVTEANNYFHGAITQSPGGVNNATAWIYNSNGTIVESNFLIYNNFFTYSDAFGPSDGLLVKYQIRLKSSIIPSSEMVLA